MVNDIFCFLECCYNKLILKELEMCEELMITIIIFHLCHHH